jgi:hydroxymethylbilane synthase
MPDDQPNGAVSAASFPLSRHDRSIGRSLRAGTRGSPLALVQTRHVVALAQAFCAQHRRAEVFEEHIIKTTGDAVQDRPLSEIGGKGLFAKEIHESLLAGRIDFAVHSLKDLETALPPGIVLACTLAREDARDTLILGPDCAQPDARYPYAALPRGALVGTSSVRRQAQLLYARPDLRTGLLRGNVQTRLSKVRGGEVSASLLALAGLNRLGLAHEAGVLLDPETMVPSACQGIVGVTARADDADLLTLLAAIEDQGARAAALAERALLAALDGSCRTPIAGYAKLLRDDVMQLTGLAARADGTFLLKRSMKARIADAEALGRELGRSIRADSPPDIFA